MVPARQIEELTIDPQVVEFERFAARARDETSAAAEAETRDPARFKWIEFACAILSVSRKQMSFERF
jgi:hypothetical protein